MKLTRRRFTLALAMTPGIGGALLTRVLTRCEALQCDGDSFFKLSPQALQEDFGLPPRVAETLADYSHNADKAAGEYLEKLESRGVQVVTAADAHFPESLAKFMPDHPALLFLFGNGHLLNAKTFSVLSSKEASTTELDRIEKLAEEGILRSEILVTSATRPEYQRSAVVPLRWGSPRILCLDRGVEATLGEDLTEEPFRAARLWRYQFDPKCDLVVSPYRPTMKFGRATAKTRDFLVAGLSRRIDFVRINPGGVMRQVLGHALASGRPCRVCQSDPNFDEWKGLGVEGIDI